MSNLGGSSQYKLTVTLEEVGSARSKLVGYKSVNMPSYEQGAHVCVRGDGKVIIIPKCNCNEPEDRAPQSVQRATPVPTPKPDPMATPVSMPRPDPMATPVSTPRPDLMATLVPSLGLTRWLHLPPQPSLAQCSINKKRQLSELFIRNSPGWRLGDKVLSMADQKRLRTTVQGKSDIEVMDLTGVNVRMIDAPPKASMSARRLMPPVAPEAESRITFLPPGQRIPFQRARTPKLMAEDFEYVRNVFNWLMGLGGSCMVCTAGGLPDGAINFSKCDKHLGAFPDLAFENFLEWKGYWEDSGTLTAGTACYVCFYPWIFCNLIMRNLQEVPCNAKDTLIPLLWLVCRMADLKGEVFASLGNSLDVPENDEDFRATMVRPVKYRGVYYCLGFVIACSVYDLNQAMQRDVGTK
ncbi:hypothetical protein BGX38DRAFT_1144112 [Terfezia claveryi]|nr:hypothetical protein BGX38DRAFT_1144112 [Terfezia claveryi]